MRVFERTASKRRREELDPPTRVTCMRCRRQYTPDPWVTTVCDLYCWWCIERIGPPPTSE